MANAPIARDELTATLFDLLKAGMAPALAGRGIAPPGGGSSVGTAVDGDFVEYAVLKTGPATTPAPGERDRLGRHGTSWLLSYQVAYHSVMETSVDKLAHKGRTAIVALDGVLTLDGVEWTVQECAIPKLGDTRRDDTTNPSHWSVTDDVSLHLSRVLTR